MRLRFPTLRLTHKIAAIGALGIAGLALIGAIYLVSTTSQERYRRGAENARQISQQANRFALHFLEARRRREGLPARAEGDAHRPAPRTVRQDRD